MRPTLNSIVRKPLTVIIVTLSVVCTLKGMLRWSIQRIKAMLLCIDYRILFVDTVDTKIKACKALNFRSYSQMQRTSKLRKNLNHVALVWRDKQVNAILLLYYRPQRSWGKVIFSQVSVILSTRGVCVVARKRAWLCVCVCDCGGGRLGGMHGCGGHAWLLGGMHGCQGACMVAGGMHGCRGGVWLLGGACMVARGGCVWLQGGEHGGWVCVVARGPCVVAGGVHSWGACMGYKEIWSMSGRYASYWNAFLFFVISQRNQYLTTSQTVHKYRSRFHEPVLSRTDGVFIIISTYI